MHIVIAQKTNTQLMSPLLWDLEDHSSISWLFELYGKIWVGVGSIYREFLPSQLFKLKTWNYS